MAFRDNSFNRIEPAVWFECGLAEMETVSRASRGKTVKIGFPLILSLKARSTYSLDRYQKHERNAITGKHAASIHDANARISDYSVERGAVERRCDLLHAVKSLMK